ncbi:heterocycloanthracin/sonorensin family bacteriocin [Aneurinibacillus danicus]|uniref:heterocycloanthracin/sonorensin family bacteriocin n=1 Tax=Aneurinibacillus danicus TaxID=267746 RepID=UPI0011BE0FC7|nr:heterocycloanthracin/sonorensin family bacteriocin [Aneurinibacillus danicus]
MDNFKDELQELNVADFGAGQLVYYDNQGQPYVDQSRQFFNCFNCARCFNCFNCARCFNCFHCSNCARCFNCFHCARCGGGR